MNVDDLVFETPNKIRRQDFHEASEHDKIHFALLENLQHFLLGLGPIRPRQIMKRQPGLLRLRLQIAVIADDAADVHF